jgi:hypothetical protein
MYRYRRGEAFSLHLAALKHLLDGGAVKTEGDGNIVRAVGSLHFERASNSRRQSAACVTSGRGFELTDVSTAAP